MEITRTHRPSGLWIVAAVAASAAVDAISTYAGLQRGATEMNGAAAGLFSAVGTIPVLLLRVVIPVALAFLALHFTDRLRGRDRMLHTVTAGALLFVAVAWLAAGASNTFGWL